MSSKLEEARHAAQRRDRIPWDEAGDVVVSEAWSRLRESRDSEKFLGAILSAVWVSAYTEGWSDGLRNIDPNWRDNPYAQQEVGDE